MSENASKEEFIKEVFAQARPYSGGLPLHFRFDAETRTNYDRALHDVAYLERLDRYALNQVAELAGEHWSSHVKSAADLMAWNPNYNYPDEYRNGREIEYWLEHEYQTRKCAKVRQAIDQIRNPPPQPMTNQTSRTIPNETLNQWLQDALDFESFIDTLTRFQQEVLYHHAVDYQNKVFDKYISLDAVFNTDEERHAALAKQFEKLSNETHFEEVKLLKNRLKRLLNPEAVVSEEAGTSMNVTNTKSSTLIQPPDEDEMRESILKILAPLGGLNPQKQRIMSEKDFERLIEYTNELVLHDTPPPLDTKPIPRTGISIVHIRYTFYLLHKTLFGTRRIRPNFIVFLHKIFSQFADTEPETTKAKFSTPPKYYEKDFAGYIGEAS